jgi:phosphinothricin acetyltransferase
MTTALIRHARPEDLPAVTAINAWHVAHSTATFEIDAPSLEEMTRRHDDVVAQKWPWLVAELTGGVVGYAYANQFRPRPGYRYCVEDSIYLAPEVMGRGIGKALLGELLQICEGQGARQMLALIGDASNAASIALPRRFGFVDAGAMRDVGWKLGRWLDVLVLQRSLGAGSTQPG